MQVAFESFVELLRKRLQEPLPGARAHEQLKATPVGPVRPKFEYKSPPKPGSVLILLYQDGNKIRFPLTKRPDYLGAHGGQVSLPGGKAEEGETIEQTALREAEEEVGAHPLQIELLGRLSTFFVFASNFSVTPVIGVQRTAPLFTPDPVEVVKILHADLDDLVADYAIQTKEILAARIYPMMAPHFLIEGEVVWGATAMMLNELRVILRETVLK